MGGDDGGLCGSGGHGLDVRGRRPGVDRVAEGRAREGDPEQAGGDRAAEGAAEVGPGLPREEAEQGGRRGSPTARA